MSYHLEGEWRAVVDRHIGELLAKRNSYIEVLAAAWFKTYPDLDPADAELVEVRSADGLTTTWSFRRKETGGPA